MRDLSKNRRLDLDWVKQLLHHFLGTFLLVRQCIVPERTASPGQPVMEYKQHSHARFKKHGGGQCSAKSDGCAELGQPQQLAT